MSLNQIHELDKIVRRKHRNLKLGLKLLEMKKVIYNKLHSIADDVTDTYKDIFNRFFYEETKLAYSKKR